ncbi:MAG: hypothetical protein PVH29_05135 [Candidatus Zixiibacteriota bacterium]|jgi:hypothetical protein
MEVVDLGDGVRVGAIFEESGKIKPVWFAYNGRRLAIERVTYAWKERDGDVSIRHYAVKVGGTVYELAFDTSTLAWRLARSYIE